MRDMKFEQQHEAARAHDNADVADAEIVSVIASHTGDVASVEYCEETENDCGCDASDVADDDGSDAATENWMTLTAAIKQHCADTEDGRRDAEPY